MLVRKPSRTARRAAAELRWCRAAGKRNEERGSNQLCVVCQGEKVVPCSICGGTGEDALAEFVEGVRSATGESDAPSAATIMVEDWDSGPQQARPRRSCEGGGQRSRRHGLAPCVAGAHVPRHPEGLSR